MTDMASNGDGFTGINVTAARSQLETLNEMAYEAYNKIYNGVNNFLEESLKKWGSPNAVNFSDTLKKSYSDFLMNFANEVYNSISSINSSAQTLAKNNGASWSDVDCTLRRDCSFNIGLQSSVDGIVGMAVDQMRILRDVLKSSIDQGMEMISYLPKSISFYSADGSLLEAYSTGIDELIEEITSKNSVVFQTIDQLLETETNNVLLSKEKAASTLRA